MKKWLGIIIAAAIVIVGAVFAFGKFLAQTTKYWEGFWDGFGTAFIVLGLAALVIFITNLVKKAKKKKNERDDEKVESVQFDNKK